MILIPGNFLLEISHIQLHFSCRIDGSLFTVDDQELAPQSTLQPRQFPAKIGPRARLIVFWPEQGCQFIAAMRLSSTGQVS